MKDQEALIAVMANQVAPTVTVEWIIKFVRRTEIKLIPFHHLKRTRTICAVFV